MPIPNTTPRELISALAARIQSITPTEEYLRTSHWRYEPDFEIGGQEVRTFDIVGDPERLVIEGIWGADGVEYEFDFRVIVTYEGLKPSDARRLAGSDGGDLWTCLNNSVAVVPGMLPSRRLDYDIESFGVDEGGEDDDGGRVDFVYQFVFTVNFKRQDTVSLAP